MNPAMLLNPKGFAKEQQKKKKAPNYGPKQTRKPTAANEEETKVVLPTYDPRTLLDPKAAAKSKGKSAVMGTPQSTSDSSTTAVDQKDDPERANGGTSLYERHHHVSKRDAPMSVKRKAPDDVDEENEETKKHKATFGPIGRGTILSEHMRKEREALNVDAPPPVDLTGDVEDDNELEIVGANDLSKEVCMGMITVNVNAHSVPHTSSTVAARLGTQFWPQTRVHLYRPNPEVRQIIDVHDSTRKPFGKVDYAPASSLSMLMDGSQHTKFRAKAFLKMREREPGETPGQPISRVLRMTVTMFAIKAKVNKIGQWLKSKSLILEDPPFVDSGIELYNPHKPKINGLPDYRPLDAMKQVLARKNHSGAELAPVNRTVEEMRRETLSMFDSLIKSEDLPEMEVDATRIKTVLKPHQKQALNFLIEHEKHDYTTTDTGGFSLWKPEADKNSQMWYNVITLDKVAIKPEPTRGGILADMMGLGKSLSILSLIAQTNEASKVFARGAVPEDVLVQDGINSKATLIVCPKSVLASWEEQIQLHTAKDGRTGRDKLSYFIYHGTARPRQVADLANYNIVLTSYGTLVSDFNARTAAKRTLIRINWFRVVLDEAHAIRNAANTNSKACCELIADRRWAVTGTPIQNRLEDLGALIKFLRVKPFDNPQKWASHITAPFKNADSDVLDRLRLLIDSITLRRTRDIIQLPQRFERIVRLDGTLEENTLYAAFSSQANLRLESLVRETQGLRGKSKMHMLRSITQLRMICAHGKEMLAEEDMEDVRGLTEDYAIDLGDEPDGVDSRPFITERYAYDMLQLQLDSTVAICTMCKKSFSNTSISTGADNDSPEDSEAEDSDDPAPKQSALKSKDLLGYLTPCMHLLHPACKVEYEGTNPTSIDKFHECPACFEWVRNDYFPLTRSGLHNFNFDRSKRSGLKKKANVNVESFIPHTKVKALIEELQHSAVESSKLPAEESPIRSVVFTEWTTYLDLIEYGLELAGIGSYLRLDGTMSLNKRAEVLRQFREDPTKTVLLISIKAGGQGLNLTAANKVYLMEPQFNPGVEQQAVDRVHRLGQQREVEITHYIMTGSIEEAVVKIKDKKKKLAQLSLGRKKTYEEDEKTKLEELRTLFK